MGGGRGNQQRPAWIVALTSKEDLIQIIILTTCFLSQVISQRVIIIVWPITFVSVLGGLH